MLSPLLKKSLFTILVALLFTDIRAQSVSDTTILTLDDCIRISLENNISLKTSINNELIAKSNKMQSMMNFLPDLSAGVNYDFTFGTFFDQTAFRQVSTTTNTSDPFLRSTATIFNGFSNHNNLKRRQSELNAAEYGVQSATLDVKANVLTSYLNVILDKENLKIAQDRVNLLQAQLDREEKRESVGVGNMETVYNFRSQVANEKLNAVRLENQLKSDKLQLLQLLQVDVTKPYVIASVEISDDNPLTEIEPYGDVLEASIGYSPALRRAEANQLASTYSFKQSKAARYPTINFFAQLGSAYSSNGARSPETGDVIEDASLADQLDWNLYEYMNFTMNIPIFTKFQTNNSIQVAKLNMYNAELLTKQTELDMVNTVQAVYLDLIAAQSTYNASFENLEALEQSFSFVSKRYDTGNTDFYTYLESLNNKNRGEIELINSRYSIVFRKKILDLYKGL
ncbi:MAG: TolC family protein [Bacteroidota bacterium]